MSENRLLDDFESRTHRGTAAGGRGGHRHPACGDEVVLSVRVEAGVLRAILNVADDATSGADSSAAARHVAVGRCPQTLAQPVTHRWNGD
jgi:hypothetical protein